MLDPNPDISDISDIDLSMGNRLATTDESSSLSIVEVSYKKKHRTGEIANSYDVYLVSMNCLNQRNVDGHHEPLIYMYITQFRLIYVGCCLKVTLYFSALDSTPNTKHDSGMGLVTSTPEATSQPAVSQKAKGRSDSFITKEL